MKVPAEDVSLTDDDDDWGEDQRGKDGIVNEASGGGEDDGEREDGAGGERDCIDKGVEWSRYEEDLNGEGGVVHEQYSGCAEH